MTVARIAVSAANFAIDRPYDYKVPDSLSGLILPGMRVAVPFGRGNRHSEGVVLSLSDGSGFEKLKSVEAALDKRPVLEEEQLKLALWMSDRFFCTVYDAIRAMLPAGMWFKGGAPKLRDKTVKTALLAIPS
ncbi:MAG: hypothetical protein LBT12_02845, partial [Oscillospiraceae bacterium]|nr:hypothetical protein [Oscillospiraceae bacterium]